MALHDTERQDRILENERSYLALLDKQYTAMSNLQKAQKAYDEGLDKRQALTHKIYGVTSEIEDIERNAMGRASGLSAVDNRRIAALRSQVSSMEEQVYLDETHFETLSNTLELEKELEKRQAVRAAQLAAAKEILKSMTPILGESGNALLTMGNNISKAAKEGGILMGILTAVGEVVKLAVTRFINLQAAGQKFRETTGLTIDQSKSLVAHTVELNKNYQDMGVSIEVANEAVSSMMESVGNAKSVANMKEMTTASAMLRTNFGVAAADASGFLFQMQKVGHLTSAGAADMAGYAARLSKAAGVPLPKVMKDVSEASAETLVTVGGSVDKLVKAAVQARSLGVALNDAGKSARQFLNFGDSINAEMEASVLTGKNINFQLARQKAWNKDIAGAQAEALNQIEKAGDFTQMNACQQEALAKASGYTVEQLTKMIENKKHIASLTNEQKRAEEAIALQQKNIQSTTTNINNAFQKLTNSIADTLGPAINVIAKCFEGIADGINKGLDGMSKWPTWLKGTIGAVTLAGVAFLIIWVAIKGIGSVVDKVFGKAIKTAFKSTGEGIKALSKGVKSMGSGEALKGAFGMLMLGGAFALLALGLSKLDWSHFVMLAILIIALAGALAIMGTSAGVAYPGVGVIIAFGFAMLEMGAAALLLGIGLKLATPAIQAFGEVISKIFVGLKELISTIGKTIKEVIVGASDPLIDLAKHAGGLGLAAVGIGAIAVAMASFGGGSLIGGIGTGIGKLFGGNMVSNLTKLAGLGDGLNSVASALSSISESLITISSVKIDTKPITDMMDSSAKVNASSGFSNVISAVVGGNKEKKSSDESQQKVIEVLSQLVDALNSGIEIKNFEVLKLSRKIAMSTNKHGATIAPI